MGEVLLLFYLKDSTYKLRKLYKTTYIISLFSDHLFNLSPGLFSLLLHQILCPRNFIKFYTILNFEFPSIHTYQILEEK